MRTMRSALRSLHPNRCTAASVRVPTRVDAKASDFFAATARSIALFQAQVSHDLLEPAILLLELAQSAQLGRPDAAVLLLPHVERRLADAHLAAHLLDAPASSFCFSAKAMWSSVNLLLFTTCSRPLRALIMPVAL